MISEEKVTEVFRTLNNCNIDYANGKICEFTQEQKDHYELLLNDLEREQASKTSSTKDKGAALENLVNYLLQCSGDLFEVYNDVRTNTNEIDQIIKLKVKGRMLRSLGVLDERYDEFICECKNYKNRVGVTYVGKFCSLMNSCNIKFGVLFSYRGVTGSGWGASFGGYNLAFFNGTSFEGSEKGLEALTRIMDVVGVAKWEDIKGHYVRVKQEDRLVVGIGNVIEDKWFEPREFFKEVENE
jgi:hypothetical protein